MERKFENSVWVLLAEWVYDGEGGQSVLVFKEFKDAQKEMNENFANLKSEWGYDPDGRICVAEIYPTNASLGNDEEWSWYHCTWEITEQVVR